MTLENIKLDVDYARSKFPAFKDNLSKDWIFCENAGGSYVPKNVIERLNSFMTSTKVQPYAEYSMSKLAGNQMDEAIELFSKMINANKKEILIGGSTSINLYVLANALKSTIQPGDEIIVTNQDHEANISPWRRLEQAGAKIIEWKLNPKNGELEIDTLIKLLNKKTKILAVTHCSNIVGSINNLKKITEIAHNYNAIVIGDGVSYAPHGFPDMKELGVDFYTFSLYKTYGPHLGLLYGKEEILKNLPNQNHEFLEGQYPYTLNPGGPNHEELASIIGIYEYMMLIYNHHFNKNDLSIINKIKNINNLISRHEEFIANPILEFLNENRKVNLIGKLTIEDKNRAPTISFIVKNMSSKIIANRLVKNKIATRNDNFYAWRCLKALGIDTEDGVIRISLTHYNTIQETEIIIKTLDKII